MQSLGVVLITTDDMSQNARRDAVLAAHCIVSDPVRVFIQSRPRGHFKGRNNDETKSLSSCDQFLSAFNYALQHGWDNCIVLEDDTYLTEKWEEGVRKLECRLHHTHIPFDVLYLGGLAFDIKKESCCAFWKGLYLCIHACVYSKRFMERMSHETAHSICSYVPRPYPGYLWWNNPFNNMQFDMYLLESAYQGLIEVEAVDIPVVHQTSIARFQTLSNLTFSASSFVRHGTYVILFVCLFIIVRIVLWLI
jgi:hypothetical protein